jgi:hypothetical protein
MGDTNVLMPPDYLYRLLRGWRADTGLVSSPPIGCAPGNVWAELECAFLNTYQARWMKSASVRNVVNGDEALLARRHRAGACAVSAESVCASAVCVPKIGFG